MARSRHPLSHWYSFFVALIPSLPFSLFHITYCDCTHVLLTHVLLVFCSAQRPKSLCLQSLLSCLMIYMCFSDVFRWSQLFCIVIHMCFSEVFHWPQLSWLRSISFSAVSSCMTLPLHFLLLSRCDCIRLFAIVFLGYLFPWVCASQSWFCASPPAFQCAIFILALLGIFALSLLCCFLWDECRYEIRRFRFSGVSVPTSNVSELDANLFRCSLFVRLEPSTPPLWPTASAYIYCCRMLWLHTYFRLTLYRFRVISKRSVLPLRVFDWALPIHCLGSLADIIYFF